VHDFDALNFIAHCLEMSDIAIRFPLFHAPEISVEFFPDELPEDHYDLIDGLRLELAPLKVWKQCAVRFLLIESTGFMLLY
jgi:hypothetical protein